MIHTALGAWQSHPIHLPSLHGRKDLLFQVVFPPVTQLTSESVVGIKPGGSGVVIWYQADQFTYTWSTGCFIAQSHIYPSFMAKVSTLTYFPLEPRCEDYSFFDQALEDLEDGLDSIPLDSVNTAQLDSSFDETESMPSSVSSGILC